MQCSLCQNDFKTGSFYQHKKTCGIDATPESVELEFKCEKCPYISKYKHALKRHTRTCQKVKTVQYQCNKCDKSFTSKFNYTRHTTDVHSKKAPEKVIQCQECGMDFREIRSMKRHLKNKHSLVKKENYTTIESPIGFAHFVDQTHENNESETVTKDTDIDSQSPYSCDKCEYTSEIKCNFERHIKSIHYSCDNHPDCYKNGF